jgi:hypothetical protein
MARKVDVARLKSRSIKALHEVMAQFDAAAAKLGASEYLLVRWMAQMTAVEVHSIWERYVEDRLVAALNQDARHFLKQEEIGGVKLVSTGLAYFVVRSGGWFF